MSGYECWKSSEPDVVRIVRADPLDNGKINEKTFVHHNIVNDLLDWQAGRKLIQNAFPYLNAESREFIMTGIMPESWNTHIKGEDE